MVSLQAIVLFASATIGQQGPVLLEFTSTTCGPCQRMRPVIEKMKAAGYPVQEVDYDQRTDLAQQFRITEVPTFVLVANGRVVARRSGACSSEQLAGMFTALKPAGAAANLAGRAGPVMPNPNPPVLQAPPLDPPSAAFAGNSTAAFNARAPMTHPPAQPPMNRNVAHTPAANAHTPAANAPPARHVPPAYAEQSSSIAMDTSPQADRYTPQPAPYIRPSSRAVQPPPASQFTSAPAPAGGDAAERMAMHASVRIEVKDADGASFATGTIIDRHGDELLVLTCGHVFKSSNGKGQILVDTFYPGGGQDVPGQLVAWEVKGRDVGLISFRPQAAPQVAKLALQKNYRKGDLVFSVGCDHGADPTLQMTRITSIDRYHGASNIEIAGQPVDGRSGGGLFTSKGELIGVCNAADPTDDEGIYAALPAIQKHLVANGMRHMVTGEMPVGRPAGQPVAPSASSNNTIASTMPARAFSDAPPIRNVSTGSASTGSVSRGGASSNGQTEVIVVIRPAGGQEKVMTIRQPSRELLRQMQQESSRSDSPSSGPIMSAGRMTPIIRGQSIR